MFRPLGAALLYSFALALFYFSPCIEGFVLSPLGWSQIRPDAGHQGVCSRRPRQSGALRMQAEWFNVKALQDLQQKIQKKKEKVVDTGPSVILGEAPWGRYGERNQGMQI
jgi:hypothetical protein